MGEPLYIALDPGGTTGYATFNSEGKSRDIEYLAMDEVRERVMQDIWDAIAIICEDWRLRPEMAKHFYWSQMPTAKLIGWVEGVCYMRSIPFVLQGAQIKSTGYKHWGKKPLPKSNPMNHAYDAVVHGREYLIKQKVIKP